MGRVPTGTHRPPTRTSKSTPRSLQDFGHTSCRDDPALLTTMSGMMGAPWVLVRRGTCRQEATRSGRRTNGVTSEPAQHDSENTDLT